MRTFAELSLLKRFTDQYSAVSESLEWFPEIID